MNHRVFARIRPLYRLAVFMAALAIVAANFLSAYAASLDTASLSLSDPRTGETATYTFTANGFSAAAKCIALEFNTAADGGGSVPGGLTTTGASLDASGTMITEASWTEAFTVNGTLELTFATGETPADAGTLVFTGIVNGNTEETTYYGLFNTYSDTGCTTAVDSVVIAFVYNDGELVSLSIEPTLTFTVNTVATGVSVNGAANTTVASGASGIDFTNTVTAVANGLSAHRLDVSTNANGGYVVYVRHTGQLTNPSSDTIDDHSGTNGSPTAFPAAGTEAWGYTTEDSTLTGGTADRFTSVGGDKWAGFTTSNQPVMDNTAATSGTDQTNVGHQVGIAATTEAGTYNTTIIYTIVATY